MRTKATTKPRIAHDFRIPQFPAWRNTRPCRHQDGSRTSTSNIASVDNCVRSIGHNEIESKREDVSTKVILCHIPATGQVFHDRLTATHSSEILQCVHARRELERKCICFSADSVWSCGKVATVLRRTRFREADIARCGQAES